jgi:hypothetical protein
MSTCTTLPPCGTVPGCLLQRSRFTAYHRAALSQRMGLGLDASIIGF